MDKIVRSTVPLIYDARTGESGIVAIKISDWHREERLNRYKAIVQDFKVLDVENPASGTALKDYQFIGSRTVTYTNEEIDALFTQINIPVLPTESYTDKQKDLLAFAVLAEVKRKLLYGSTAEQWEIIDRDLEIAPQT